MPKNKKKLKTFPMYIDRKITIWERYHYVVEATSKEQAENFIRNEMNDNELPSTDDINFTECEVLYDTTEYLTPDDNDGQPTVEAFHDNGNQVE